MIKTFLFALLTITFCCIGCTNIKVTVEPTRVVVATEIASKPTTTPTVTLTSTSTTAPTVFPTDTAVPTQSPTNTPTPLPSPIPLPATSFLNTDLVRSNDSFQIVNQMGGAVTAIAVQKNLAYLGIGSRLAVADVSDPTQPRIVSWSNILPKPAQQITIHDQLAFVALGDAGIWIFDISDPTTFVLLGHVQTTMPTNQFLLHDSLIYAIDPSSSPEPDQILSIVDISEPMNPIEINTFNLPSQATKLAIIEDYLYVSIYPYHANYENTLWVLDISDIRSPQFVTAVSELAGEDMIVFDKDLILTKIQSNWLTRIDLSDPLHPTEISLNLPSGFFGASTIHLNKNIIYVASTFSDAGYCAAGVSAFDMTDINNIHKLDGLGAGDCGIPKIAITNDQLYMGTNSGLSIIDISNPAKMVQLSKLSTTLPFDQLAIGADLFAMGRQGNGVRIFDFNLDDPTFPHLIGDYYADYLVNDFTANESQTYLATYWENIVTIDMADPNNIGETAVTASEFRAENNNNLIISNDRLYASQDGNLRIFDPITLEWIGGDKPGGEKYGKYGSFVVDNHTLWSWINTVEEKGLFAFDITDPNQFVQIGFLPIELETSNRRLFVNQGYIYILSLCDNYSSSICQNSTLRIIDASTPEDMKLITTLPFAATVRTMTIADDKLLLVGDDLWLVDNKNPLQPEIVNQFITPEDAKDAVILNDLVYVADGDGGLLILQIIE